MFIFINVAAGDIPTRCARFLSTDKPLQREWKMGKTIKE